MEEDEIPTALDSLLASSAAAGRADSEGSFTINFEAARTKLSKFQLSNPSFYLLKFLQAAVWGGGSSVNLVIGFRESIFLVNDWSPEPETIPSRICQPELVSGDDPIDSLVVGLRALLAQGAAIALQFPHLAKDNILVLSEKLEWRTSHQAIESFGITVRFPKTQTRSRAEDLKVLTQSCYCYPLKLTVNGKPFEGLEPYWPDQTELGQHLPGSTVLAKASAEQEGIRHVLVRASLGREAKVSFLRGGVVSDVVQHELKVPGLDILADGEELETDLTGLQVRRDDKLQKLLTSIKLDPDQLKKDAREKVMGLQVSSVPPQMGHMNTGLAVIFSGLFLYLVLRIQWFLILHLGGGIGFAVVLAAIPALWGGFVMLDKVGISVSHAPDSMKRNVIAEMLDKLK